jgi:predicted porin
MSMRVPLTAVALCAAAISGAASAQSNVTLYGLLDVTVRYADNAAAGGASNTSLGDGAYTGSRFGLRGSEDLGGGLRAFFNLEQGLAPTTGTLQQATTTANYGQSLAPNGRMWGRAALVGLATPLGSISLGRQYTLAHDMSGRFQPQSNPNQDSLSVFSGHHVSRQDNMIKYNHKVGPVGIALSATASDGNGRAKGVAGSYTAGPIDLVAYAQHMDSFDGAETRKIVGLGGSYAVTKDLKAYLGGMQRSHEVSAQKNKVVTVGVNYSVSGAVNLTGGYTQDRRSGTNAGSRKVAFAGAGYLLSKRTDLYVEVDNNKLSGSFPLPGFMGVRDSQTGVSTGLRHRF